MVVVSYCVGSFGQEVPGCKSKSTCSECIQKFGCVWCSDPVSRFGFVPQISTKRKTLKKICFAKLFLCNGF